VVREHQFGAEKMHYFSQMIHEACDLSMFFAEPIHPRAFVL